MNLNETVQILEREMRFSVPVLVTTLIVSSGAAVSPAAALGLGFEFPTLTWPVTLPAPTPTQPAADCTDPGSADAALCPAPSR
jgi:hypothetical protein